MLFKNKNKLIEFGNFIINLEEVSLITRSPDLEQDNLKIQIIFKNSNIEIPFNTREILNEAYELIKDKLKEIK